MVKIFVGNLASGTTVEELRKLFEEYGKITECDIVKNFGFVHMNSKSEAEEAIRNLHHHELNGEPMNVEMSKGRPKSTTKLHVSNLGDGCSADDLRAKFEEFGSVVECDIVKDYAFIHMEHVDDAMEAISKLDNTAFQGKLMSVQLSTSRLRTAPGMGDQTGCYVCGKQGHWSKDCPVGRNGSHGDGPMRGRRGFPRGPPGYGRGGGYGMPRAPPADYMGGPEYSRAGYLGGPPPPPRRLSYGSREYNELRERFTSRAPTSFLERSSPYERDRYTSVDYYEKFRARPFGASYFEDRRLSYIPPPPPPSSSLSRLSSSLDPYDRRPLAPAAAAAAAAATASYYARDRSPIRRVPVASASYAYERSRLSPMSASRSASYALPRAKDPYAERPRYAY